MDLHSKILYSRDSVMYFYIFSDSNLYSPRYIIDTRGKNDGLNVMDLYRS